MARLPAELLPVPNAPLEAALIVGHTTRHGGRVWLRRPDAPRCVVTATAPDGRVACARDVLPDPARDHTATVDLEGLAPDTRYALAVRGVGEGARPALDRAGVLRTFPDAPCERLAFGLVSCHFPYALDPGVPGAVRLAPTVGVLDALGEALAAHDARFVLHAGDQVYADGLAPLDVTRLARDGSPADALAAWRALYRAHWGLDAMARVHASVANYMIWDDHDIGDNWGSLPAPRDPVARAAHARQFDAARRAYEEYQHAHNPPTAQGRYAYAFACGPAAVFVLDLRGRRDADRRRLLGATQWAALEAWLAASADAPVRFVVSSVPPHHVPEGLVARVTQPAAAAAQRLPEALFDRWEADAFRHELDRFMSALLAAPGAVPIVLAGDIHIGTAAEVQDRASGRRVHQWVSSPVTNPQGALNRLKAQVLARATNAATRWPLRQHFHEQRNNFAIVELTRAAGAVGYAVAFHLYAWDGARARRAFTVVRPPDGGPAVCTQGA